MKILVFYDRNGPDIFKADSNLEAQLVLQYKLEERIIGDWYQLNQLEEAKEAVKMPMSAARFMNRYRNEPYSDYDWKELKEIPNAR